MGMKPKECHSNVWWYAANDPEKKCKAVTGWWVQWPDLVLHSVIERDGNLFCITPFDEAELDFIPDDQVVWAKKDEGYIALRNDREICGLRIRVFPEFTMARVNIVKERLLSGADPRRAIHFSDEELASLKRKYMQHGDYTYRAVR